jgi:hypothetical protein
MKSSHFASRTDESKPHRFVIYLPSCQADGEPIPNFETLTDEMARTLCLKFGGATSYPATGYFERADHSVQKEAIRVLEFFCTPEELSRKGDFVWQLLTKLRAALQQESMACSLDGRMILVLE